MPCSSSTALVNFAQVNAGWSTYKDKHRKCSLLHQWQSEKVIANLSHLSHVQITQEHYFVTLSKYSLNRMQKFSKILDTCHVLKIW